MGASLVEGMRSGDQHAEGELPTLMIPGAALGAVPLPLELVLWTAPPLPLPLELILWTAPAREGLQDSSTRHTRRPPAAVQQELRLEAHLPGAASPSSVMGRLGEKCGGGPVGAPTRDPGVALLGHVLHGREAKHPGRAREGGVGGGAGGGRGGRGFGEGGDGRDRKVRTVFFHFPG